LVVFGYAVDFDVDRVDTVVCDLDRSARSRELARGLAADGTFRIVGPATDCAHPEADIRTGRADAAVVLPAGLARDLAGDRPVAVQVLVDGTDPVMGRFATNAATMLFQQASLPLVQERLARARSRAGVEPAVPSIRPVLRFFYNPSLRSPVFMVPGVAAMILLVVTTIAAAMGLSREREIGTLEQVMVTPVRPWELLVGKLLPFVVLGAFDVLLVLAVGTWLFDVPMRGSLWLVALGTLLYLMSTVGIGLFVSTISRNQQQAFMAGFLIVMPALLLSGVLTPVENMPQWIRPLTWINPVRYYVEILRGLLLRAASLHDLRGSFAALAIFGPLILGLAAARFRKRLA
jgi:ABC-2 type transport system permease protein